MADVIENARKLKGTALLARDRGDFETARKVLKDAESNGCSSFGFCESLGVREFAGAKAQYACHSLPTIFSLPRRLVRDDADVSAEQHPGIAGAHPDHARVRLHQRQQLRSKQRAGNSRGQ